MAHKQENQAVVKSSAPGTTMEAVLADWKARGNTLYQTQKNVPGQKTTLRRLKTLVRLARKDTEALFARGTTQAHLDALEQLRATGAVMLPMPKQEKKDAQAIPKPPKALLSRAEQRVMGTRSVAASRLGESNTLAAALGFKDPTEKTGPALNGALESQRLVILQKDANGHDLPGADANRTILARIGFDQKYIDDMIAPLLIELAPFVVDATPTEPPSVMEWECVAIVAAKYFYEEAELALRSSSRVAKYQAAQPMSQMGRFKRRTKPAPDQPTSEAAPRVPGKKSKRRGRKSAKSDESKTSDSTSSGDGGATGATLSPGESKSVKPPAGASDASGESGPKKS